MLGIAVARDLTFMLACAGFMGVSLPLLTIGYLTLIQKRTPQAVMGRVSTAAEVVMSVPGAISLALGAALVSIPRLPGDLRDHRRGPPWPARPTSGCGCATRSARTGGQAPAQ